MDKETLLRADKNTQAVYDRQAKHWHDQRLETLYEKKWLDRFENHLASHSSVLDIGCGSGKPIAAYFLKKGYTLTGVDYAPNMLKIARATLPEGQWIEADITTYPFNSLYDGIYSWDGFFHLNRNEQKSLLPKLAQHLKSGGVLLLTVGHGNGEVLGTVGGETVYHASLAPDEYEQILRAHGFTEIQVRIDDQDALGRSILFAVKE